MGLNINIYDNENAKINEYNLQLRNATYMIANGAGFGFTSHTLLDGSTVVKTSSDSGLIYDLEADKGTIDIPHCRNSFSTTSEHVERLIQNPPSPLYLNYYECTSGLWNIILNASGVTGAN